MSETSFLTYFTDLVSRLVSRIASVRADCVSRAEDHADLILRTEEARAGLETIAGHQVWLNDYLDVAEGRMSALHEASGILTDRISQMQDHITALVEDEARVQAALASVTGHSRAVSDIARLARLLAINASVEAARAGEAGRGFAVVAKEMQALSDQSGKRAKEIDTVVDMLMERLRRMRERAVSSQVPIGELERASDIFQSTLTTSRSRVSEAKERGEIASRDMFREIDNMRAIFDDLSACEEQMRAVASGSDDSLRLGRDVLSMLDRSASPSASGGAVRHPS